MRLRNGLGFAVGALAGVVGAWAAIQYQKDRRRVRTDLSRLSQVVGLRHGLVEVAVRGDGPPILVSHGAAGGFDQGLLIGQPFSEAGFRVLAVSRGGYLRTPLTSGSTPSAQASIYKELLDFLSVDQVAMLGVSAGGPSAVEFALAYPERCAALVLISAVTQALRLPADSLLVQLLQGVLLRWNAFPWLVYRLVPRLILRELGADPAALSARTRDPIVDASIRALIQPVTLTPELRRAGSLRDIEQLAKLPGYRFEEIEAPTLILHGVLDRFVTIEQPRAAAARIPSVELAEAADGGHLCVLTHQSDAIPLVVRFLQAHLSPLSQRQGHVP